VRVAVISHACVIDVNQRLFKQLCSAHPDVELLLIAPQRWKASTGREVAFAEVEDAGFRSQPLPVIGSGQISLHLYRGLARALREYRPEIVYLDEEPYSLPAWQTLRICRRAGWPICFVSEQNRVKRFPWPFSQVERAMLRTAALVLPSADEVAEVLRAKGAAGPIVVIPHFVDTELFRPLDRSGLRRELALRGRVIGYMGRLTPEKGLDDLREAAETLLRRGDDVSLLLVGSGPMADALRQWSRAHEPGRVVLAGAVPHTAVPDYLNVCDLLVAPSRTAANWEEQFGRVVIEAAACAVPVVGSSSGHIPKLVEELQSGVIFPERDPDALAEAIAGMLADPAAAAEMGRGARMRVEERYGLTAVADRLYEALSTVVR